MAVSVMFLLHCSRLNVQRKETSTSMRLGLRCDRSMGFSGKKITRPKEQEKENNFSREVGLDGCAPAGHVH